MQNNETSMHAPVLVPASEFQILFVPIETAASAGMTRTPTEEDRPPTPQQAEGTSTTLSPSQQHQQLQNSPSQYCRLLGELLSCSPFRLPVEYERRILTKADRMKRIQQDVLALPEDQQAKFQEELNRGFRDWLVTSGNLRQVLDLVHLERRGGV